MSLRPRWLTPKDVRCGLRDRRAPRGRPGLDEQECSADSCDPLEILVRRQKDGLLGCAGYRLTWVRVTVKARLDVGMQMRHEVAENLVVDFVSGVGSLKCLTRLQQVGEEIATLLGRQLMRLAHVAATGQYAPARHMLFE